ncbi:MAG: hypothetical protein U9R44_01535 [Candidatus Omnitrophota bacterium]|nr:hypothetical protein [Candidatus Omnitrophota bacterium]
MLKGRHITLAVFLLAVMFYMPFSLCFAGGNEDHGKTVKEIEEYLENGGSYMAALEKVETKEKDRDTGDPPGNIRTGDKKQRGTVPEPLNRKKVNKGDKGSPDDEGKNEQDSSAQKGGSFMTSVIATIGDVYLKLKDGLELGVDVKEEFDTNIYQTWDIKNRQDFITTVSPKVSYTLDSGILGGILYGKKNRSKSDVLPEIKLSLDMDIEYYMRTPELNKDNSADSFLQPQFSVQLTPEDNLKLYYRSSFKRQNIANIDPIGSEKEKKKVDTRTTSYGVDYTFGPKEQTWTVSYSHNETEHDDEDTLDTKQNDWNIRTNLNTTPSYLPKIFLDYEGQVSDQSNGKKNTHELFLGLDGKMSPKISGEVKAGYGLAFAEGGKNVPYGSFVANVDLTYRITNRFSCTFDFKKTLEDVSFFGIEESPETSGEILDAGTGTATDTFNVPRQLRDSMEYSVGCSYTPPFLSDNLRLNADVSQRELEYSDGGRQKVREAGVSYTYTWNMNRPFSESDKKKKQPIRIGSEWTMEGSFRAQLQSPATKWSRFGDNVISLIFSTKFW